MEHGEEQEGDMSEQEGKQDREEEQSTQPMARLKKDTNILFYPKCLQALLDLAKVRMHLHIAAEDGFPRLEVAVDGRCREVLHEAMVFYKTNKWKLETGKASMEICFY